PSGQAQRRRQPECCPAFRGDEHPDATRDQGRRGEEASRRREGEAAAARGALRVHRLTARVLLRRGDRGREVRDLRARLAAAGLAVAAGDLYDETLEARVREFQEHRRLRVDGICGPETWGALIESGFHLGDRLLYLSSPMLRGDDVIELQRQLNALGFDAGREDGILGPDTETALRQFQRNAGTTAAGVFGPATLGAVQRV